MIAGSINLDGPLLIRSSGAGTATRWAQICRSVRDALSRRGAIQRLADRVVAVAVPLVLALSLLTVLYWAHRLPFDRALLVGLAVLVVACPCAVGLAAPLATSIGIGRLARSGCLVRDPGALEALARTRLIAFDKTGTLTSGEARVVNIETEGVEADEALARAAGLERHSEHGLARAISLAAAARGLQPVAPRDVQIVPGRGIFGSADGQLVAAGNGPFMSDLGWSLEPGLSARARSQEAAGHSVVYVGWGGRVYAVLSLDNSTLPEARATIDALRRRQLNVALLTGDTATAARRIAAAIRIDDVEAGLSPEAKRAALDRRRRVHKVVAMVGDGLNDGLVLAEADVGIAVGSATDLARETAAIVLPINGFWMLPWVVDVARAVRKTILTNLMWAFGYNIIALSLAALGALQPILAAAAMAGSSVLVVVNSLRLARLPDPSPSLPRRSKPETSGQARFADSRSGDQSRADGAPQPNMSCVNASYQPPAWRTASRRVSGLSPILLMKMSLILIVPSASLKLMASLTASSAARKVKQVLNRWGATGCDPLELRRDGESAGLGLGVGAKRRFRHIAGAGRVPYHMDAWLKRQFEGHRIDRAPTRLIREAGLLRQFAGDLRRNDIGDACIECLARRLDRSAL